MIRALRAFVLVPVAATLVATSPVASGHVAAAAAHQSAAPASSPPNVNIVGTDPRAKFKPGHVTVAVVPLQQCSSSDYSGTLTNTTSAAETVTYQGQAVYTIEPGQTQYACAPAPGRYVFGLQSSPKARLVVIAH